jgi:hypothetical protein
MSEIGKSFGFDQDITSEWIEDNAGSNGNKALESGNYNFRIVEMVRKTCGGAKYDGNPMAQLVYEYEGTKIYDWIILNTDFKQRIANFLKAVFGNETPPKSFWDKLIGKEIILEVEKFVDVWVNKEGEEVESYKNKVVKMLPFGEDFIFGPNGKTPASEPKIKLRTGEVTTKSALEGVPPQQDLPF